MKKYGCGLKRAFALLLAALLALPAFANLAGCSPSGIQGSDICVTEIVTSNAQSLTDENYGSPDWIEIYNPTGERVELGGYRLRNASKNADYTFPEGAAIEAGKYLVILCVEDSRGDAETLAAPFNLSSSGVQLSLWNAAGRSLQNINVPPLETDVSYAMRTDGSFGYAVSPTPGAANSDKAIFASIAEARGGAEASGELRISEVKRGDDGFVELYNPTDGAVQLGGFCLSDEAERMNKWSFPSCELPAGGYAVVYMKGSGYIGDKQAESGEVLGFNADFKLNSTECSVYLFAGGGLISELTFDPAMPDGVAAIRTEEGIAYTGCPTPGYENSDRSFAEIRWNQADGSAALRISEVMIDNKYGITDKFGERSSWVEIHNTTGESISLLGYYLTDDSTEPDKWAFPDVTIAPGEYMLIFCSKRSSSDTDELHASFGLSLNDEGVFLVTFDGMRMDGVIFPSELAGNISIGRDESGAILYYPQPTPGEANTTAGFAEPMSVGGFDPSSCYISETCSVNEPRSGILDWIELYNGSEESMTLTGWHLSDSENDLYKFGLSHITIPAGGYAVISCSSSILDAAPEIAPFSISPAGETLFLTDENGGIVDAFSTGTNKLGVTSGRREGEAERVYFATATRGARNAELCYLSYAAAPTLSDTEIYHTGAFSLELAKANADGIIRYTLDGSKPTETSPEYTGAILIDKNTVVRAAVFVPGMLPSDTVSMTYLFDAPHEIPIVTLAMDERDFAEVYAVSKPFVPVVERECYLQFFEKDGTLGVESPAGVRVSGASTRAYPQKSLGVYFRSGYGRSEITYPFFGEDYFKTFGSLVLRNAGQDYSKARIRDSFASKAMVGLNLDTSESRFVAVYINGEYWGLYDLKENMNEDYLETHFGADPDTANIIKRNTMELAGSNEDFLRVRAFAAHFDEFGGNSYVIPMTDERYEQFKQWVDVENIMDYLIARTYLSDFDMFNQKYWRTTDYAVKWRAIFFDSDFAMSSASGNVLYHYFNVAGVPSANGSLSQMDIFCGLNSNESWRHGFLVRYIYVMKYHLNAERLTALLDEMAAEMSTEMDRHIARWGTPVSRSAWEEEIAKLRQMLVDRPEIAASQLRSYYGLSQEQYAALEAEADAIHSGGQ